jgi:hypothetical protein|tara:strand:+ start:255 stop:707 length:453 start_codon:yes stop_codon:yes gene_type:complete
MTQKTTANLKEGSTWLRLVFIILFSTILNITTCVIAVVVVIQFLSKLFTGKVVENGTIFGQNLSTYVYEIVRFLTFKSDEMPWPINPWPSGQPSDDPGEEQAEKKSADFEDSESDDPDETDEKAEPTAPAKAKRRVAKITKTKPPTKSGS